VFLNPIRTHRVTSLFAGCHMDTSFQFVANEILTWISQFQWLHSQTSTYCNLCFHGFSQILSAVASNLAVTTVRFAYHFGLSLLHEYRQGGNMPSGMNVWSLVKTRWLTRSPIRGWNLTCANSEIPFSKFRKKGRWRNEFFQLSNLRFAFWDVSSFLSSFDVGFWEVWFYINAFYKGSKIRSPSWTS